MALKPQLGNSNDEATEDLIVPPYLIETDWLADHLEDPSIRILDVTGMLTSNLANIAHDRSFVEGHIPGAQFFDMASSKGLLSDPDADLPWTWPSAARVEAALGGVGVDNDAHVILYAATPRPGVDRGVMWCTRAWWTLHHFGARCSVLNGGLEKWIAEGRAVAKGPAEAPTPALFKASGDGREAIATKKEVQAAISGDDVCVVDALDAGSYEGSKPGKAYARAGHITGAINAPMAELLQEDGSTFHGPVRLRERLAARGLGQDQPAITYCGGGIAATVDAFVMKMLGNEMVRVYDNSLFEWAADQTLPMTNPAAEDT